MLTSSIVALFLAIILFFVGILPSLAAAQQQQLQQQTTATTTTPPSSSLSITTIPPLTPEEQEQQNRLQSVIAATTANLNETEKQVSGIVYTPRWSEPFWVNANSIAVLIAYCLPGEFADSGQEILGGFELEVLESYAIDLPQGFMAWMALVGNEDVENRRLPAAVGVICASDLNQPETRVLSAEEQQQINNVNQQFSTTQNTPITNIDQVINIINDVTGTTTPTQNETGGGGMTPSVPATNDTGTTQQPLRVEIIPNATQGVVPVTFRFDAVITGGVEPYTIDWNWGSGHDGNERPYNLTLLVTEPKKFNVILTVEDSAGQSDADVVVITTRPPRIPGGGAGGIPENATITADTTPPVVTVPPSYTVTSDNPVGYRQVWITQAEDDLDGIAILEIDNVLRQVDDPAIGGNTVGGSITISCNPPSGSIFPIGDTTVQCTAVDASGNTGTASFTVGVNPPPISSPFLAQEQPPPPAASEEEGGGDTTEEEGAEGTPSSTTEEGEEEPLAPPPPSDGTGGEGAGESPTDEEEQPTTPADGGG